MKNILKFQNYLNFQNLTFFGLLILAYQNFESRNKINELNSNIEYALFELEEIKKETKEANKYAKSANTMAFSIFSEIENDFASITISDNGTGIDKSIISKITEPYYTTKIGNSGLGLAITKKIIDDHNGIILIKPSKASKGTSVILKFPLISKLKKEKNK